MPAAGISFPEIFDAMRLSVSAVDENGQTVLTNPAHRTMFAGTEAIAALRLTQDAELPRSPVHTIALSDGRFLHAQHARTASGLLVSVCSDVTVLKQKEALLQQQADNDELTGLPTRRVFLKALQAIVTGNGGADAALALVDIDQFKQINDTLGHDTGDQVLLEVPACLRGLIRAGDVAARLGGDEFGIVFSAFHDETRLRARMDELLQRLSSSLELGGHRICMTLSAGVARAPRDGTSPSQLMQSADLALYDAKRSGRARSSFYSREQSRTVITEREKVLRLREAIAEGSIAAEWRPKRRRCGAHGGFAALPRWPRRSACRLRSTA